MWKHTASVGRLQLKHRLYAAHFWFVFLTATCLCCGEDLPRSLHKKKNRQQEQVFVTITSYMRPCKQQNYFFAHGIAHVLISPLLITAWLLGRSRLQSSSLCCGLGLTQKARESYFLVPLLKARQHFSVSVWWGWCSPCWCKGSP